MRYLGDFDKLTVIHGKFTTYRPSTGEAFSLTGSPSLQVYKDDDVTQSTAGVTLVTDFDGIVGLNHVTIDTSADSVFYSDGSNFSVIVDAGAVDSVSVVGSVVASFTIRKSAALKPTTAGRLLDVNADGEAGIDWANVGSPTTVIDFSGTTVGTLTAYTGNTPQTGDSFARIGAAGAGLTALGDTRLANLDAAVSSRMATYVQPTGFLAATFPAGTVASTTNITAGTITTVGTLTTYTGNTPQTGDSFARIGAAGAGLTALGDTRIANLDATISSRMATYAQPAGFLAATFPTGTIANTTNITAGTLTTVTNLTNLPTVPAGWLTASGIAAQALTSSKFAAGAITSTVLATDCITSSQLAETAVNEIISTLASSASVADISSRLPASLSTDGFIKADIEAANDQVTSAAGLAQMGDEYNSGAKIGAVVKETMASGLAGFFTEDTGLVYTDIATGSLLRELVRAVFHETIASYTTSGEFGNTIRTTLDATISSRSSLDAAGVRSAVGLALANLDSQLAALGVVLARLNTAMELNSGNYRFTTAALAQAPSGGSGDTPGTTTLLDRLTAMRASLLDNLDAAVSSRMQGGPMPTNFSDLVIDSDGKVLATVSGNAAITSNTKRNQSLPNYPFLMTDSARHAPVTGKTVTVTRSIDGGPFLAGNLTTVQEVGAGIYKTSFTAADTNGSIILLRATAPGCDDCLERIITQP